MRRSILVIALVAAVTGCANFESGYMGRAPTGLQPLNLGWERDLSVTWESSQPHGSPVVSGYVTNTSPYDLANTRVLVEALDAGGQVIEQRLGYLPGELRGGGRLYFEVPMAQAPAYRVRVFSYDRMEAGLMTCGRT
jgi:hypothetical protein